MKKDVKIFKITLSAMIISAFLFMPLTVNGQAGKTNFSGTWALNADKSNFGGGMGQGQGQPPQGQPPQGQPGQGQGMRGGFGGGNFVAKQDDNLLTVDRTRPDQSGTPQTISSKYTLDGKECVNTSGMGDAKSIATWSADGKSLTIVTTRTFDRDGQSMTMKTSEVWTLTSPTTLSIVSTRTTPNGDRTSTMVYDKK
ncbi:MAG: hypothetical protein ABSA76_05230 [Bacteroidales bacterium]